MFYEQDVISLKCANGDKCPIITTVAHISWQKLTIMKFSSNKFSAFDVLDCLSMISVKLFILPDYFVPFRQTNAPFFSWRLLCRWSWVTCMLSDWAFWPAPALLHWVACSSFLSHLLWAFSHVYLYHFSPLMRIGWAHWCIWGLGARCPHASQWSLLAAVIGLFLPRVLSPLKVTYFRPSVPFSLTVFVCLSMSLFLFLFHRWPLLLE